MEMAGAMLEPDWIDLAGPLAKLAGFINDVRKLNKVGSVSSDLSKELNVLQKLESELTAMSNGVYDAKKVEAYAKETSTYKDLKKAEETFAGAGGNWKNINEVTGSWSAMMWDKGNKIEHFVIIKGIDDSGKVLIHDPWKGTSYKMMEKEFKEKWYCSI